jgi:hypothetical protein
MEKLRIGTEENRKSKRQQVKTGKAPHSSSRLRRSLRPTNTVCGLRKAAFAPDKLIVIALAFTRQSTTP